MLKLFSIYLLFMSTLYAQSYTFTELRYSDALDKSISLDGEISFFKNSLNIKYLKYNKSLNYKDSVLTYIEDSKVIDLDTLQVQQITQYFEILMLLHEGNDTYINKIFTVVKRDVNTQLIPKTSLSEYIKKIELYKEQGEIKK